MLDSVESVVCLMLANPVEVVALACEDQVWQPVLLELLGPCNVRGEALTPDNLFESVKLMKAPSWHYRTEVQGLLESACLGVTLGKYRTLEEVPSFHTTALPATAPVWITKFQVHSAPVCVLLILSAKFIAEPRS